MATELPYANKIVLPMVDNIHEVLVAFFRTSEQGVWSIDDTQPSDQFNMHFIRGNWRKSFFGLSSKRVPGAGSRDVDGNEVTAVRPMQLVATIRPSPQELVISIRHTVFYDMSYGSGEFAKRVIAQWQTVTSSEIDALRDYLRKCYDLAELPDLRTDQPKQ
jgi:hypothetical protein